MKDFVWGSSEAEQELPKKEDEDKTNSTEGSGQFKAEGFHIWFYKGITSTSISELATAIHRMEIKSQKQSIEFECEPFPIHLHIHSYGGSVFAGFAGLDIILGCKVPVYTYIEGAAASAATFLSLAGTKRFIGENSFILIHQLRSMFWGKHEEFKDEMKNNELLMSKIRDFYQTKANLSQEDLENLLKRDLWLSSKQALEFGLVDKII